MFQVLPTALQSSAKVHQSWPRRYLPSHLTHVTKVHAGGWVDLQIQVYFPGIQFEEKAAKPGGIQVKIGLGAWKNLHPPESSQAYWSLRVDHVAPGVPLRFRYRNSNQPWQPITPLTTMERVYETPYVPHLHYSWQHQPPKFERARVLLETTLEGLLAGYRGGILAPRSREEMFLDSIAQQILKTDIPGSLSEWAIDELMVPTTSSVADRAHLNHKFNYLTYDVADVDWQLGRAHDFMQLVDRFYAYGIALVPDLSFVHQVSRPFAGSLDQIYRSDSQEKIFVDPAAYQFRDYGTWLFKLDDSEVRQQLVEKIVAFVAQYHIKMIRLDYLDGLILQYSKRDINFGAVFLQELKAELRAFDPEVRILGETFEVGDHIVIKECIDIFYAPFGFSIIEELCKPPSQRLRPLFPDLDRLVVDLNYASQEQRRNALYVQLHDELGYDEHIAAGRPRVPWAYGKNPAQLAKAEGEELIQMGLLQPEALLDYVHRTVRNTEALTMFTANLLYMFVPAVDSLALGGLDEPDQWKVQWKGVTPKQLEIWKKTGLSETEILFLHDKHRAEMIELRRIFRRYTPVNPSNLQPMTQIQVCHVDSENAIIGLFRRNLETQSHSIVTLFNLGANPFQGDLYPYEFPVPHAWNKNWEVLFDGDWATLDPLRSSDKANHPSKGYKPGTLLQTTQGKFLHGADVLSLRLGARSLLVLKYCNYGSPDTLDRA